MAPHPIRTRPPMPVRHPLLPSLLLLAAACAGEPEPFVRTATGGPETSAIRFQAVDAGTGRALADDTLTVRYLVRRPITLDASAVEEVRADEPYAVRHPVAGDSLILEVRLEAPSYHRLDTVLAARQGAEVGPYTLRMSRRLEGIADATAVHDEPAPSPTGAVGSGAALSGAAPSTAPARSDPEPVRRPARSDPVPVRPPDRAPLEEGNRAFEAERFAAAIEAFQRMDRPTDPTGDYARAYQAARVRQGEAHINRGEYGGALDALEEAVAMELPNARAWLLLGRAQCAVGRVEEGRATLDDLTRVVGRLPGAAQDQLLVLRRYQLGVCAQQEFERTAGTEPVFLITGGEAMRELRAFLREAEAVSDPAPILERAMVDARDRIEAVRRRLREGGE